MIRPFFTKQDAIAGLVQHIDEGVERPVDVHDVLLQKAAVFAMDEINKQTLSAYSYRDVVMSIQQATQKVEI